MVRHVVVWRIKGDSPEDKKAVAVDLKCLLEALNGRIPGLRRLVVGLNASPSPDSSDIVLFSEFDSWEALAAYASHPEHLAVLPRVRSATQERRVVDYESETEKRI